MHIDNLDSRMSLIHAKEAGEFLAYLVDKDFEGAINGCSDNTVSIREILDYVETKTGKSRLSVPWVRQRRIMANQTIASTRIKRKSWAISSQT